MVKFGSARIGENGKATGGQRGDQTGLEVCEQEAYWHPNGWTGYRAIDPNIANGIAFVMACACRTNIVGYNQDDRYAIFWTNFDQFTNADCSTLSPYCAVRAGVNVNCDGIWTGNLGERLMETGAFEKFVVKDLNALCTGDILVDGKGTSHTVVVTEGNQRGYNPVFDSPEPVLQWGSQGDEVRKLQIFLRDFCDQHITVDGDFKSQTAEALKNFQRFFGIMVDAIYGNQSKWVLNCVLVMKGLQPV